jgi:hypothetical protein
VGHDESEGEAGGRTDLFPGGVPELEILARDIAACEGRLTDLSESIIEALPESIIEALEAGPTDNTGDRPG